jgi:hypothetical protein
MSDDQGRCLLWLALAGALASSPGCGAGARPPPARSPTTAEATDAGLPVPPPSTEKGIIVPSDVGLGRGAPGPEGIGASGPTASPPIVSPTLSN